MFTDFAAIDRYLLSKSLSEEDQDTKMVMIDQKVPQNSIMDIDNDVMFANFTSGEKIDYKVSDFLSMGEFAPIDPTPTVYIQQVSESNDQQVFGSESPKSFVDLDNVPGDVSLYDENVTIKREKDGFSNCCYTNNISSQNQDMMLVKQESDDFGYTILQYNKQEIEHVCEILRIDTDPMKWSVEDVRKWIVWQAREFKEPHINVELFQMDGPALCRLTPDDFRQRTQVAGSNLFFQLDVWRNVSACKMEEPPYEDQLYQQNVEYSFLPTSHEIRAPCVSPCPSTTSEDSNSSSSNLSCSHIPSSDEEYIPYQRSKKGRICGEAEQQKHTQTIHLWQFLKELLLHPESYSNCIKWINRDTGIFKIEDSVRVAKLWGRRKNRPAMNYDKLSRSIRQYYKKGIIKKTEHSKRLVYQFCQPYL